MANAPVSSTSANGTVSRRAIRYTSLVRPDEVVLRKFALPELRYAIESAGTAAVGAADVTLIRFSATAKGTPNPSSRLNEIALTSGGITVRWLLGEIEVEGPSENTDSLLPALLEFDHLARELEKFEQLLPEMERVAQTDVPFSYRIHARDRQQWGRLGDTMEELARLRLRFAQLSTLPHTPALDLSLQGKRLFRRLTRKAALEARLEAVSERLEALEDLYEGAVDRINDHRYWRDGHLLEIIIIVLLFLECVVITLDIFSVFG